mmetsp:Transcript_26365/g.26612  ORF Transcript_26365/g.26612 Transcript_26365/m.26612 type:complete len:285 (+) Transcript_26365:46-900(+)|eukprot:CAMPEP_0182429008 /NCGR_PEP_ID=MMETSP1167-20130531/25407_1 /TAXON_ID=2988 /ORGANISM="Mallomonas Sp, Strain CCMP3275" /LENGTH=284 /DNA_ID=CAMNT_0024612297 /DNA_START=39 /DNA_END=893 /DNA_ORIENTATION=+
MGAASSTILSNNEMSQEELVQLMMPPYYVNDVVVSETDIALGRLSWKKITEGTSREYRKMQESSDFKESSCLTWFYNSFYERMFDINPGSRPLFKTSIMSQGKVLMGIITTALNQLKQPDTFRTMLVKLTNVHSQRGVRGMQYGIAGDVLFWTLKKVLGDEDFDDETQEAWANIFSYILSVMVPVAVADEIEELRLIRDGTIPADETLMLAPSPTDDVNSTEPVGTWSDYLNPFKNFVPPPTPKIGTKSFPVMDFIAASSPALKHKSNSTLTAQNSNVENSFVN